MTPAKARESDLHTVEALGQLLRAYRKSRGLTQASAAALAGVGERFLSELERGKATAEVGLVLQVIERYGLTLSLTRRGGGPVLPTLPASEGPSAARASDPARGVGAQNLDER